MLKLSISLIFLLCCSCELICFDNLEISIHPSGDKSILYKDDKIRIDFPEAVDKESFTDAFSVTGPSGVETGDFFWSASSVSFNPLSEFVPGSKYSIAIEGTLETEDGRAYRKNILSRFFYATDAPPPVLLSYSPEDAEVAGNDAVLVFSFSKAIDTESFKEGLQLTPAINHSTVWNEESTIVRISPESGWSNLSPCRWLLSETITDKEGIPLPENQNGLFLVQKNTAATEFLTACPAVDNLDGTFSVTDTLSLDDLTVNQHIAILFSEETDFETLRKSLSFQPDISGYLIELTPKKFLYYINEKLPPAQPYTLAFAEGIETYNGNTAYEDIEIKFTPDIPKLSIVDVQIESHGGLVTSIDPEDLSDDKLIDSSGISYFDAGKLYFIIRLSAGFPESSPANRSEFESTIGIMPLFPPGTAIPNVYSVWWENSSRLRLMFEGLTEGTEESPVYYRFYINKGSLLSATPEGSYLTDKVSFSFKGGIE